MRGPSIKDGFLNTTASPLLASVVLLGVFVLLTLWRVATEAGGSTALLSLSADSLLGRWMVWLSLLGEAWFVGGVLLAVGAFCWIRGIEKAATIFQALLAFAGAAALVALLKLVLHIERPMGGVVETDGFSYPSGHATLSLLGYGLAAWLLGVKLAQRRALIACALVLALAIGISRVLLGVHTVADVVGGFLLGGAILLLSFAWLEGSGRGGDHAIGSDASARSRGTAARSRTGSSLTTASTPSLARRATSSGVLTGHTNTASEEGMAAAQEASNHSP